MTVIRFPLQPTSAGEKPANDPLSVTIAEALRLTGYKGRSTAHRFIKDGKWRTVGTRRGRRVIYASLVEWLEEQGK